LGSKRDFLAAAEVETFSNLDVEGKHLEVACKPIFGQKTFAACVMGEEVLKRGDLRSCGGPTVAKPCESNIHPKA